MVALKSLHANIILYGPSQSGKTTNIQFIHKKLRPNQRGQISRVEQDGFPHISYEYLPIELGNLKGFDTNIYLYTCPIHDDGLETRLSLLKDASGIVFVVDSSPDRLDDDIDALNTLKEELRYWNIDFASFPIVFQYNKRDLPNALSREELDAYLNPENREAFEAITNQGQGVRESFGLISKMAVRRVRLKELQISENQTHNNNEANSNKQSTQYQNQQHTKPILPPSSMPQLVDNDELEIDDQDREAQSEKLNTPKEQSVQIKDSQGLEDHPEDFLKTVFSFNSMENSNLTEMEAIEAEGDDFESDSIDYDQPIILTSNQATNELEPKTSFDSSIGVIDNDFSEITLDNEINIKTYADDDDDTSSNLKFRWSMRSIKSEPDNKSNSDDMILEDIQDDLSEKLDDDLILDEDVVNPNIEKSDIKNGEKHEDENLKTNDVDYYNEEKIESVPIDEIIEKYSSNEEVKTEKIFKKTEGEISFDGRKNDEDHSSVKNTNEDEPNNVGHVDIRSLDEDNEEKVSSDTRLESGTNSLDERVDEETNSNLYEFENEFPKEVVDNVEVSENNINEPSIISWKEAYQQDKGTLILPVVIQLENPIKKIEIDIKIQIAKLLDISDDK